jgi:signal transduction histidine kinase
MIFKKISNQIAIQFMAFVFVLLLITGGIFITADIISRDQFVQMRLERQLQPILERSMAFGTLPPIPPFQRDRIRIVNKEGDSLFSGTLYEAIPFIPSDDVTTVIIGEESYTILTVPFLQNEQLIGYIQVAERSIPHDSVFRILLFLLISAGISGLTFGVGLFFARRSLKPAEQMMERLEQFTQDASHELRTPLTAVSTSLDMALIEDDHKEYIRTAKKDLKEVVTLVERLLELAQLDKFALQTESVDLQSIVEDAIEKYRPFAEEKSITIETNVTPVILSGDSTLLRRVIGNLLANAIKFNNPNGRIFIRLTPEVLSVEDTGKGIAEKALPHIFDRFYQEDISRTKSAEGLGLGLALVKRIVELHGWTIDVVSEEGKGTTFTVYFA